MKMDALGHALALSKITDSFRQHDELPATFTPLVAPQASYRVLDRVAPGDLYGRSTASVIPDLDEPCHQALLACFMLAFSMPFERVGDMPAELTIAYTRWTSAQLVLSAQRCLFLY